MRLENILEQYTISGTTAMIITASSGFMVLTMMNVTTIFIAAMNISSGKWWANSVMSNRSVVMRDMI